MMQKIQTAANWAWVLVIAAIFWAFTQNRPEPTTNEITKATPSAEVSGVDKEEIKPEKVKAYPNSAKKKQHLPESVKQDDALHVLDSSALPESDRPMVVTHILNENTGETQVLVEKRPYPLIQTSSDNELSVMVGVKNGGRKVLRGGASADLVQIKSVHVGVHATIYSDGQYFAGGGVRIPLE